ncbi:MAG: hypothetical protein ABIP51_18110 [Bacteroidia bacterium]
MVKNRRVEVKQLSPNEIKLVTIFATSKADEATKDDYSNIKWQTVFNEFYFQKEKELKNGQK